MENPGQILSRLSEDNGQHDSCCHQKDTHCSDTLVALTDMACTKTQRKTGSAGKVAREWSALLFTGFHAPLVQATDSMSLVGLRAEEGRKL